MLDGEIGRGLLAALPARVVLRAADAHGALVALLASEVGRDRPGQQAVLDRLLDVVLVAVLRGWLAGGGAAGPSPYAAQRDPVVGRAVQLLQNDPAYGWTVPDLAQRLGVSRAALARRFTELVGEAPMIFLAGWRPALAADLLQDPQTTLGAVARQVGHGSPFALSAAFQRVHGVSPTAHRQRLLAAAVSGWKPAGGGRLEAGPGELRAAPGVAELPSWTARGPEMAGRLGCSRWLRCRHRGWAGVRADRLMRTKIGRATVVAVLPDRKAHP